MTETRQLDLLAKRGFLTGSRQKWAVVFLLWGMLILAANVLYPHVDVAPFLSYAAMIGSTFLLGLSVDSAIKTNSASKLQQAQIKRNPADYEDEN